MPMSGRPSKSLWMIENFFSFFSYRARESDGHGVADLTGDLDLAAAPFELVVESLGARPRDE